MIRLTTQEIHDLIIQMQSGEMQAFDPFYDATKQDLYYSIYAIMRDETLAEDVLQETYLKFLEHLPKINPQLEPVGLLFRISRNLALAELKKRKRELALEDDPNQETKEGVSYDNKVEDEQAFFTKMAHLLKPNEYEIVILHVVNELSHQEIAKRLKRPLGTITWAYNNAIKKLKKGMADEYEQD